MEMVRAERLHETATDEAEKKEATAIYSKAEAAIKELGNTACRIFRIFKDSKECGNPYLDINDFHKTFCIDSRLVPLKSNPDFFFSCGLCCEQVNSVSDAFVLSGLPNNKAETGSERNNACRRSVM